MMNPYCIFPKWMSVKFLFLYCITLAVVSLLYSKYMLHFGLMFAGFMEVFVFFHFSNKFSKEWNVEKVKSSCLFERKIFWFGFWYRFFVVVVMYISFQILYGDAFGFHNADAKYYHDVACRLVDASLSGNFFSVLHEILDYTDISDMGYSVYLSFLYLISFKSIILVRIIKCLLSAYTVVLVYRIGSNQWNEIIGRLSAIFCMLWTNFAFYCGTQLKEVEMVFILALFAYIMDNNMRANRLSLWKFSPLLLLVAIMFTFRTPIAIIMVLSLLFTIIFSKKSVISYSTRIIIGSFLAILTFLTMGDKLKQETEQLIQQVQSSQQKDNMEWRGKRDNGNAFAKYAGAAVFAPLIFTIPFPTMVETREQYDVKSVNGGNFCKNIISLFTIVGVFSLLFSGNWRKNILPLLLLVGYLIVLILSVFAQSERFHQPVMPFEFMFAAYGIFKVVHGDGKRSFISRNGGLRQLVRFWMFVIFVACVAWNWFKLAGRGMI